MIDVINEILEKKWKELETENTEKKMIEAVEKLFDIVSELNATNDFINEYKKFIKKIETNEIDDESKEHLLEMLTNKWTFIMCFVLNLDFNNPFVLSCMNEVLYILSEE